MSVLFLGDVAWPQSNEPRWQGAAVVVGMATSVLGMGVRFLSHFKD